MRRGKDAHLRFTGERAQNNAYVDFILDTSLSVKQPVGRLAGASRMTVS